MSNCFDLMINRLYVPKYGKLYELGREGHSGFSHYNDLPFYGYYVDYMGPTKFPNGGVLFLENCRENKLLLHYSQEFKTLSFPKDQHLTKVREVVCIQRSDEIVNPDLKKYLLENTIPLLYRQNLEEHLNRK